MVTPQAIEPSEANKSTLRLLMHSPALLSRRGFALTQLTTAELEKKKRCDRCTKVLTTGDIRAAQTANESSFSDSAADTLVPGMATLATTELDDDIPIISKKNSGSENSGARGRRAKDKEVMKCLYHPGKAQGGRWTCCQNSLMSKPCCKEVAHSPRGYAPRELEDQWRFHSTRYRRDSDPANRTLVYAVSIDCEMGTNEYGESELIRVSVIDYFTGAVLLDKLVWPDVKMKHYNTRFSGVSAREINDARRRKTCLFGRAAAREAIWKFVGPETIVIGHAVHGDLASLRWVHHRIVDTLLIEEDCIRREKAKREKEEEKKALEEQQAREEAGLPPLEVIPEDERPKAPKVPQPPMGLKALSQQRLNRTIQVNGRGHDSVEDALATRDLLHWHVTNRATIHW